MTLPDTRVHIMLQACPTLNLNACKQGTPGAMDPTSPVAMRPTKGSRSIMATHIAKGCSTDTEGGGTCCTSTSNSGCMPVVGGELSSGGSVVLAQP